MNKAVSYAAAILIVLVGAGLFLFREIFFDRKEAISNALVRAQDVSATDFYIRYQEIAGADYYDLPISEEILSTYAINLVGDYNKDENREMFLSSRLTKYVNDAEPYFKDSKEVIPTNLENWNNVEEFVPEFKNSSYYQYRQCTKAKSSDDTDIYMCVVSSIVKEKYLFTVVLHGNGTVTNEELENVLEAALRDKQKILERLP